MEEKNKFELDVEVVSQALKRRSGKDTPKIESQKLYERFCSTKQEPVKLAVALRGYFLDATANHQKTDYEIYLKSRIRPAIKALIEEDSVTKMMQLEEKGWFGQLELEDFIKTAKNRQKTSSLVWLLHLKNEKYGYEEEDFSL